MTKKSIEQKAEAKQPVELSEEQIGRVRGGGSTKGFIGLEQDGFIGLEQDGFKAGADLSKK